MQTIEHGDRGNMSIIPVKKMLRQEDYEILGQSELQKETVKQTKRPAWTKLGVSISNKTKQNRFT